MFTGCRSCLLPNDICPLSWTFLMEPAYLESLPANLRVYVNFVTFLGHYKFASRLRSTVTVQRSPIALVYRSWIVMSFAQELNTQNWLGIHISIKNTTGAGARGEASGARRPAFMCTRLRKHLTVKQGCQSSVFYLKFIIFLSNSQSNLFSQKFFFFLKSDFFFALFSKIQEIIYLNNKCNFYESQNTKQI